MIIWCKSVNLHCIFNFNRQHYPKQHTISNVHNFEQLMVKCLAQGQLSVNLVVVALGDLHKYLNH